jgi:fumarate reductase subunit C
MSEPEETRAERYLRFSQGSMIVTLALVLALGIICVGMALEPEVGSQWMARSGWMLAVAIAIAVVTLQAATLRGDRWNPRAPEAMAIAHDEWRRTSMDRAMRVAFLVVIGAQLPLAFLLGRLPSLRAVMAMAGATASLGMATFIALFLVLSRQASDGR